MRWAIAGSIVIAGVVTLPAAALIGAFSYLSGGVPLACSVEQIRPSDLGELGLAWCPARDDLT